MPWYYANPDREPLGPFSQQELMAKRAEGLISPETFILEEGSASPPVWRRYQEIFPPSALPVLPAIPVLPTAGTSPAPPHLAPQVRLVKTNTWSVLGCILGIMSVVLTPLCCVGFILSFPGLIFSGLGFYEIERNQPYETGKSLAITGLIASCLSLFLLVGGIVWLLHTPRDFSYSFQHLLNPPSSFH